MGYKKLLEQFSIIFIATIYTSCSIKDMPIKIREEDSKPNSSYSKLHLLADEIIKKCNIKSSSDIVVKKYNNKIEIDLNSNNIFTSAYYTLSNEAKNKLSCITPIINSYTPTTIQIIGYADELKNRKKNQHLADNRAITVAELLFNQGIRDEIFAKGCLNKSIKNQDNQNIEIYIYKNKFQLERNCY